MVIILFEITEIKTEDSLRIFCGWEILGKFSFNYEQRIQLEDPPDPVESQK